LIHTGLTQEHLDKYQGWPWLLALLQAFVEAKHNNLMDGEL